LDLNDPNDQKLIDDFNMKLYNHYKYSINSKHKDDNLKEFDVEYDKVDPSKIVRVSVKPHIGHDSNGKEYKIYFSYTFSTRLLKNGEEKAYIIRHKQKYYMKKKSLINSKRYMCKYLDIIKSGRVVDDKFIIDKLDEYKFADEDLFNYLNDSSVDVNVKKGIKDVLDSNEYTNKTKIDKLNKLIDESELIPNEYKLNSKQISSYVYRK
jgi:hypothetical protein